MKKILTFGLAIILAMFTTKPVMAVENIFEKDLFTYKEGQISVYNQRIRENIKGEAADCDCVGMCYCTQLYHVLEDAEQHDFYSIFFERNFRRPLGTVYQDCSSSMEKTFSYEKSKIINNLSPFFYEQGKQIEKVFKNKKTDLFGLLNSLNKEVIDDKSITMPDDIPIIITDLWDTAGKEETFKYDGEIIFCVPYASTNEEGVLHCEDFVNNLLWNHSWNLISMDIYIVYIDEVIVRYSKSLISDYYGSITIYIP